MTRVDVFALVMMLVGVLCMCGGIFDWAWMINSRRAWIIRKIFGYMGARVYYVACGMLLVFLGLVSLALRLRGTL